jgi:hypothetical protein
LLKNEMGACLFLSKCSKAEGNDIGTLSYVMIYKNLACLNV